MLCGLVFGLLAFAGNFTPVMAQGGNETVFKANIVRGSVTVYINGQSVGKVGSAGILGDKPGEGLASKTVDPLVRGGQNTMRLVWSGEQYPLGEVHISHATGGGNFREITRVEFGVFSKAKGEKTVTFVLPDAAGALPKGSNKNPGGAFPAPDPNAAQSGRVTPGSSARQTLMNANLTRGNITVYINDKKVGSYASGLVPLDVSNYVHSGANELRVEWAKSDAVPMGSISISYAAEKDKFRTVGKYDLNVFVKKTTGKSGVVTFNLP